MEESANVCALQLQHMHAHVHLLGMLLDGEMRICAHSCAKTEKLNQEVRFSNCNSLCFALACAFIFSLPPKGLSTNICHQHFIGCMWHYDHCRPACEERCEASICTHSQNTECLEGCFPTCPEGTLYRSG